MLQEEKLPFWAGVILTSMVWLVIWWGVASFVEFTKVENGYLTYDGKIYRVEYVADKNELVEQSLLKEKENVRRN